MKKLFCLALVLMLTLALTACGCKHETWNEADCTTPKTCAECGEIEGAPLGHSWIVATCETAKTCEDCGTTDGEALGHSWTDATCAAPKTCGTCGLTEGEALGHTWVEATTDAPKTCTGCGLTEGERIITDPRFTTESTKALYGTWVCTFDAGADMLNLEGFTGSLPIIIKIQFTNDAFMHVNMDIGDTTKFKEDLHEYLKEAVYAELEASGYTREETDDLLQSAYGMSMDEYIVQTINEMDFSEFFADLSETYVYYVEDNKLYSGSIWTGDMTGETFTLNGNTLIIEGLSEALGHSAYELSFTKVTE